MAHRAHRVFKSILYVPLRALWFSRPIPKDTKKSRWDEGWAIYGAMCICIMHKYLLSVIPKNP